MHWLYGSLEACKTGVGPVNGVAAFMTGVGLGLVSSGTLWLAVRAVVNRPRRQAVLVLDRVVRFVLVGLTLYGLSRYGVNAVLACLGGLGVGRFYLIRHLGFDHER